MPRLTGRGIPSFHRDHQSGWIASRRRRSYTSRTTASNADTSKPPSRSAEASAFETAWATDRAPGMTLVTPACAAIHASVAAGSDTPSGTAADSSAAASSPTS